MTAICLLRKGSLPTMRSTIDSGGRVTIPKAIRDQLGLAPGTVVDMAEHGGHIEIAAAETRRHLVEVDGALVVRSTDDLPLLTDDMVRETLVRVRRRVDRPPSQSAVAPRSMRGAGWEGDLDWLRSGRGLGSSSQTPTSSPATRRPRW